MWQAFLDPSITSFYIITLQCQVFHPIEKNGQIFKTQHPQFCFNQNQEQKKLKKSAIQLLKYNICFQRTFFNILMIIITPPETQIYQQETYSKHLSGSFEIRFHFIKEQPNRVYNAFLQYSQHHPLIPLLAKQHINFSHN